MAYAPLGRELLTGKYSLNHGFATDDARHMAQFAVAWVLANPAVTSAIVGARTPEQARRSAAAGGRRLSETDLAEIRRCLRTRCPTSDRALLPRQAVRRGWRDGGGLLGVVGGECLDEGFAPLQTLS